MPDIEPINLSEDILWRRLGDVTVKELFERFIGEMKVSHAQYYGKGIRGSHIPVALGTFTKAWVDRYIKGFYFFDDPIIDRVKTINTPLLWTSIDGSLTRRQEAFMAFTRKELGRNGLTVPVGGPPVVAGMSVTSDEPESEWTSRLPGIIWNATIVAQKIHTLILADKKANEDGLRGLSEGQKACLTLAANGLDPVGIGALASMSEATVRRHLDEAQTRLNARNHTHALAKAVTLGFLQL